MSVDLFIVHCPLQMNVGLFILLKILSTTTEDLVFFFFLTFSYVVFFFSRRISIACLALALRFSVLVSTLNVPKSRSQLEIKSGRRFILQTADHYDFSQTCGDLSTLIVMFVEDQNRFNIGCSVLNYIDGLNWPGVALILLMCDDAFRQH